MTIPSPHHLLRVAADRTRTIICTLPEDLCRKCMIYEPCGCSVATEDDGWAEDGLECLGDPAVQHLWIRQEDLVVPTHRCKLVEASGGGVFIYDLVTRLPNVAAPALGEHPIQGWRITAASKLQVILGDAPVEPHAELLASSVA